MLDPGSQQILELILAKNPETIDEMDRQWLTARRGYLTEAQLKQFGIEEPKASEVADEAEAGEEATPVTVKNGEGEKAVEVESAPKPPRRRK